MKSLIEKLNGKRTYILAAVGGLVVALSLAGVISPETADVLLKLIGFGGLAALRAGVAKSALRRRK